MVSPDVKIVDGVRVVMFPADYPFAVLAEGPNESGMEIEVLLGSGMCVHRAAVQAAAIIRSMATTWGLPLDDLFEHVGKELYNQNLYFTSIEKEKE